MSASNSERDDYKRRIEQRFHNPEVTEECLRQYDAKIAAQTRLSEYMQGQKAREALYREMTAAHREDARKVDEAYRTAEKAMREREKMVTALTGMRENYAKATQEVNALCGRIDAIVKEKLDAEERYADLEERYVEAVNSGRILQDKYNAAIAERDSLDSRVRHLQDQVALDNKDRFGATTERTSKLFEDEFVDEDPLREDMSDPDGTGWQESDDGSDINPEPAPDTPDANRESDITEDTGVQDDSTDDGGYGKSADYSSRTMTDKIWSLLTGGLKGQGGSRKGHKDRKQKKDRRKWKRSGIYEDISDHINVYSYDPEELEERFAGEKWRIVGFHEKKTVCETRAHNYVKHEFTPVIAIRNADGTETIVDEKAESDIYPRSYVSDTIFSALVMKRYDMSLPIYRIEHEYKARGIRLSRETICNWFMHFALGVFAPVYDRMWAWLNEHCTVQQCDETWWQIIIWPDGDDPEKRKANGSKGYIWVHTSGEFEEGNKIVLYSFEKSRSADHLREHLSNLVQYLISDAYGAYIAVETERGGSLSVCNCWMHCRRAWAKAVYVMEPGMNDISLEELKSRKEVLGLILTNAIFEADTPLKSLSADTKKRRRLEEVAPHVDEFFKFVHGIDLSDVSIDGKLKEAITYTLNQEERLRRFLENGSIPLDNGYVERCIKPVALSRRNSMFSYSVFGAECSMIMYTLVETAKANGADPYFYIKYLVNEVPKYLDGKDRLFLDDMMPWSEKYRAYERKQIRIHADERVPESEEPPNRRQKVS